MIQYKKEIGTPSTDSVTGLFNRDFFMISLEREVSRSRRSGHSFTLVMIEVDAFDVHNQKHGFLKGTRIIKDLATILLTTIRSDFDLAARFGDDVITLILPNTDTQSAMVLAKRIQRRITTETQGALTVSIGLATYPSDAILKGEALLQRAQEALTKAKLQGKNQIHFFEKQVLGSTEPVPKILVVDDNPPNRPFPS